MNPVQKSGLSERKPTFFMKNQLLFVGLITIGIKQLCANEEVDAQNIVQSYE